MSKRKVKKVDQINIQHLYYTINYTKVEIQKNLKHLRIYTKNVTILFCVSEKPNKFHFVIGKILFSELISREEIQ
jgi:hypothetical protein